MENKRLNFVKDFAKDFEPYEFDTYGYIRLPEIEITRKEFSKADVDPDSGPTHEDFLRLLVEKSFNQYLNEGIIPEDRKQDYIDRYERELKTFFELNFTDYVLLVWKVINFCEDTGIMTSFGRGSGGGSCVFYLLKITHTDPIKYELFFERFISKARAKSKVIDGVVYIDGDLAPDYDLDVQIEKRGEVIDYLKSLYKNRICKISTFSTLSSKIVMKECGKAVLNKSEEEMNDVSGMIAKNHGILEDLDVSYKLSPNFKKWVDQNKKAYDIALKLRGLIKNYSVHASGFVVAYDDLNDFLPLRLTKDNEIASAYEKETVALLTIKLDILGVRCLSVVKDILTRLNLDWRKINVDDNKIVYDILKKGLKHSHGIFQLEADCNYRVCNLVKPKDINELSDVVAIARPGALAFTHDYVNRSQEGIHPLFDPILSSTRFTILYQEQLMKLANQIGFTLEEAELLRRIVGRKKIKEVGEWKEKIEAKIKENNLPEELGILLWETFEASSKYSFNRCLLPETLVETRSGHECLFNISIGDEILAYHTVRDESHFVTVKGICEGEAEIYEIEMEDGTKIGCSMDHKFLCEDKKMHKLSDILCKDLPIMCFGNQI
jgi:DNA polymerase III subunit alpha